jgi:hypothetical protein
MICLPHFNIVPVSISTKTRNIQNPIKSTLELPIPYIGGTSSAMNMKIQSLTMSYNTAISGYPNREFNSAVDLNTIMGDIMSMAPRNRSETDMILGDKDIMDALERADCQYKEGRAKSLRNLIKDLGFELDALHD